MPVEAAVRHTKWVADPAADEIDAWLEGIEVNPADARDAVHFRRVLAARSAADDAVDELRAAVQAAREAGESWSVIGAGLGTTAEKAQKLFENLT